MPTEFDVFRKSDPVADSQFDALSMSVIAETEHARSEQLDNPESIYRACTDMKFFSQEVLGVILLDTRYRHSSTVEITKGSIKQFWAHPQGNRRVFPLRILELPSEG